MKLKKLAAAAAFSLVLALGLAPGLAQADEQGGDFTAGNLTTQFDAQSLEDATVTGVSGSYYYTGEEITPTPVVVLDEKTLVADTDYTLTYAHNKDAAFLPAASVTIEGTGKYKGKAVREFAIVKYKDTEGHWALNDNGHNWIKEATDMGLMSGYRDKGILNGLFGPNDPIKRQDIAVMLYRSANPSSTDTINPDDYAKKNTTPWTDCDGGQYYTAAMNWAYEQKVFKGDSSTDYKTVRPNASISRQELATVYGRYAKDAGKKGDGSWKKAPDYDQVESWATDGVDWCYTNKVMTGNKDTKALNPKGNATRAETAKMTVTTVNIKNGIAQPGSWEVSDSAKSILTEDQEAIYEAAEDAPEGVEAVALLATQTVAGTNYAFLGKSDEGWSVVTLNKDTKGKVSLVANNVLDLDNLKTTDVLLENESGSWTVCKPEGASLPQKAQTAFTKAASEFVGVKFEAITLLGTQVVSGTNYLILCVGTPAISDPVPQIYAVCIHEDLQGKAEVDADGTNQLDLLTYVKAAE